MKEETRSVELDRYEYGVVIHSLNDKRSALIKEKRPTDTVDRVLLKVIDAPITRKGRPGHGHR
jgi:hypothetical protein